MIISVISTWEQRHAVKHGVKDGSAIDAKPLLLIAGAGTGKTKTLAHRVAHLIVNGVDAHRILLLTFSRRAAVDMTGRVKRITAAALGTRQIDLPWAGTFHSALGFCESTRIELACSRRSRFSTDRMLPI